MNKFRLFSISLLFFASSTMALEKITEISGANVITQTQESLSLKNEQKGMVITFLSAKCPCSASHEVLLQELSLTYKDFQFVGIHSNADESSTDTTEHFSKSPVKFPVLQDNNSQWANKLGALKTPHVYVLDRQGNIVYQGGVTDSHVGPSAKQHFLKEVLEDLEASKASRHHIGRALGCYIARAED